MATWGIQYHDLTFTFIFSFGADSRCGPGPRPRMSGRMCNPDIIKIRCLRKHVLYVVCISILIIVLATCKRLLALCCLINLIWFDLIWLRISERSEYHKKCGNNIQQRDGENKKYCSQRSDQSHCQVEAQIDVLLPECEDNAVRIVRQTTDSGKWFADCTDILFTNTACTWQNSGISQTPSLMLYTR